MAIGAVSISTSAKKELAGSPFTPTSARNGTSIDGAGKVVLGNAVGGTLAALLDSREIPSGGFNLSLSGTGNFSVGTATPAARIHALSSINNTSIVLSENSIDGTQSSAEFRAMIGGGSITELGTTGPSFNVNPGLTHSGFLISNATNGIAISMTGANASLRIGNNIVGEIARFANNGNIGIGINTPTAYINIKPGTAAAGTAPIKLSAGVNLAAPEAGALEWDGGNLFFTNAATRENIFIGNSGAAAPGTTAGIVITNFYGTAATNFLGDPNSWAAVVISGVTFKIPLYT